MSYFKALAPSILPMEVLIVLVHQGEKEAIIDQLKKDYTQNRVHSDNKKRSRCEVRDVETFNGDTREADRDISN